MKVERIWAPSLPVALSRIKRRLGADAVILSQKTVRAPIWRFWQSWVEVLAADSLPLPPAPAQPATAPPTQPLQLMAAISDLRQEVARLGRPDSLVPPPWVHGMARLARRGVGPTLAAKLLENARRAVGDVTVEEAVADEALRTELASWLSERHDADPRHPRTVALVGPTGAGKTTTLAKVAAHLHLGQGWRVGLVTADTFRVGAVEQLQAYARLLGLPLEVAPTPGALERALARLTATDVVLIDTSGRGHRDRRRMEDLFAFLRLAREVGEGGADEPAAGAPLGGPTVGGGLEVHLVIAGPTRRAEVEALLTAYGPVADRALLTKLDECEAPPEALGVLAERGLPLSYCAGGQRVPEDLAPAWPDRLAQALAGGGAASTVPPAGRVPVGAAGPGV